MREPTQFKIDGTGMFRAASEIGTLSQRLSPWPSLGTSRHLLPPAIGMDRRWQSQPCAGTLPELRGAWAKDSGRTQVGKCLDDSSSSQGLMSDLP